MFNLRKIDLKLVFCYISPCNFFGKLPITHLISIKNKNKKNCGFMWLWDTFWSKKTNIGLNGHMGPLRGHNPIFFKTLFYSKIISLSIQMGSGRIIFYFNPLNGHYLYPPFFRNTKAKEEKNWPLKWPWRGGKNRPPKFLAYWYPKDAKTTIKSISTRNSHEITYGHALDA